MRRNQTPKRVNTPKPDPWLLPVLDLIAAYLAEKVRKDLTRVVRPSPQWFKKSLPSRGMKVAARALAERQRSIKAVLAARRLNLKAPSPFA